MEWADRGGWRYGGDGGGGVIDVENHMVEGDELAGVGG
jgi:hypothetical protein